MKSLRATLAGGCLTALTAAAQVTSPTNTMAGPGGDLHHPATAGETFQASEAMRVQCIQNRRIICGRILQVLPGGLVVDSGYTSLLRHPLDHSWLVPGIVEAKREPNLIEKNEPNCVCAGLVFVTDLPKLRHGKPKALDYVVLPAFPTGSFTYHPVGTMERTVRRFSGSLPAAVRLNLEAKSVEPHS